MPRRSRRATLARPWLCFRPPACSILLKVQRPDLKACALLLLLLRTCALAALSRQPQALTRFDVCPRADRDPKVDLAKGGHAAQVGLGHGMAGASLVLVICRIDASCSACPRLPPPAAARYLSLPANIEACRCS